MLIKAEASGGGGGSSFTYTGSGSPEGVQAGTVGQSYQDTTNGAIYFKAMAVFDTTGWVGMGSLPDLVITPPSSVAAGLFVDPNASDQMVLLGPGHSVAFLLSDVQAFTTGGTQNGLFFTNTGTDGTQFMGLYLGATGGNYFWGWNANGTTQFPDAINTGKSKASGALVTTTITSGTSALIDATHDRHLIVPTSTAGSVLVELSPDSFTYSTLYTKTTLASDVILVDVPGGWHVKLTATTSTLGTATVY